MKTRDVLIVAALAAMVLLASFACGPGDFSPEQEISSVRILATRAANDAIYAHPGETVTLQTLAVDGRPFPTGAMRLYWLPVVCENPAADEYYACFAGALDGGAAGLFGGGVVGTIDAGVLGGDAPDAGAVSDADAVADAGVVADADADADAVADADADADAAVLVDAGDTDGGPIPALPTLTFTVPTDIITKHTVVQGAPAPYGLMIAFNVACAGTIKLTSVDPSAGPQQVPITCVDDAGNVLGPDDYVIGFTRVYVYDSVSNKNPEIDGLILNGVETFTHVAGTELPNVLDVVPPCKGCGSLKLSVDVPESSWEIDPETKEPDGTELHESLWVDFYAIGGNVGSEARLLYEAQAGKITGTGSTVDYDAPLLGDATLWAVVHDSRQGVTWLQVNVHAP